jgi:NADH:ubiquinone oxidoreductase subunit F (NADH-binding)
VADSHTCIVDLGKNCLAFTRAESCGKCVFCREGTMQLHEILIDITEGKTAPDAIDRMVELGEGIRLGSLCALGSTAPNPVLTAIEHFREEFEVHVKKHQCPTGVCSKLAV